MIANSLSFLERRMIGQSGKLNFTFLDLTLKSNPEDSTMNFLLVNLSWITIHLTVRSVKWLSNWFLAKPMWSSWLLLVQRNYLWFLTRKLWVNLQSLKLLFNNQWTQTRIKSQSRFTLGDLLWNLFQQLICQRFASSYLSKWHFTFLRITFKFELLYH